MQVQGVINGEYIKLFRKTTLPDGLPVIVNIRTKPSMPEENRNLIDKLCGSWKHDSSLESIFAEIGNVNSRILFNRNDSGFL